MIRAAIFLAIFAYATALPFGTTDIGDWPPLPGCHYNISAQSDFDIPNNVGFHWYYDTVTSAHPLTGFTCVDWVGRFKTDNGNTGRLRALTTFQTPAQRDTVNCVGPDFADAPADFDTKCKVNGIIPLDFQIRIVDTDFTSYVVIATCAHLNGRANEAMAIIGPNKTGVDPTVRQKIIKRFVTAGWNPDMFQRVPSQSGC